MQIEQKGVPIRTMPLAILSSVPDGFRGVVEFPSVLFYTYRWYAESLLDLCVYVVLAGYQLEDLALSVILVQFILFLFK